MDDGDAILRRRRIGEKQPNPENLSSTTTTTLPAKPHYLNKRATQRNNNNNKMKTEYFSQLLFQSE